MSVKILPGAFILPLVKGSSTDLVVAANLFNRFAFAVRFDYTGPLSNAFASRFSL